MKVEEEFLKVTKTDQCLTTFQKLLIIIDLILSNEWHVSHFDREVFSK
jgi:hypothetical protein